MHPVHVHHEGAAAGGAAQILRSPRAPAHGLFREPAHPARCRLWTSTGGMLLR